MIRQLASVVPAATLLLFVSGARADVLNVPADHASIQAAIDAASDGDEILVAAGIYGETIDLEGKAIAVRSASGPAITVIDPLGADGPVVRIAAGEGEDTILEGFTIRNGRETGIWIAGASPTIVGCRVSGNEAGTLTGDDGGGVYCANGSPMLDDCLFFRNTAERGGGMFVTGASNPSIVRCQFQENSATGAGVSTGGGLYNDGASTGVLTECTFLANTAEHRGGGMYNLGDPTLDRCTFEANGADQGGGMYNTGTGSAAVIRDCLFVANTGRFGGGMDNVNASPFITGTTFDANTSESNGGGLFSSQSPSILIACVFSGNISGTGGGISTTGSGVDFPTVVDSSFCENEPQHIFGQWFDEGGNTFREVCLEPCDADLDESGAVGFGDLLVILQAWGPCGSCPEDLDASGTVDFADLLLVLALWGEVCV